MAELLGFVGFIISLFVLVGFFELVSRVGAIRKGIVALEGQAAEQTRYLAAISGNVAKWMRESSQGNVDGPKC
jgi:uncharacterized ion transporter superfamily protein YfcC